MKSNLKVLGTGCSKCLSLEKSIREVVAENNFDADIQKVDDIAQIMSYGIMMTPALVIDEKVVFSGRVPSKSELKTIIESNINA